MHISNVSVRFGLMLEAYCRGCGAYMKELSNQLVALNKMKQVTGIMQKSVSKKKGDDLLYGSSSRTKTLWAKMSIRSSRMEMVSREPIPVSIVCRKDSYGMRENMFRV